MAKSLKILIAVGCTVYVTSACSNKINISPKAFTHPIVKKAFYEEKEFRIATGEDLEKILLKIKALYEGQDMWDPEKLQEAIKKRMEQDIILFETLNGQIKDF